MNLILTAVLLIALAGFAAPDRSIPKVLRYQQSLPGTAWVSEAAVLDEKGDLRIEFFTPGDAAVLRRIEEANAGGTCRTFMTQPPLEHHLPDVTFNDLVSNARVIVSGTVLSSSQGFYGGVPGTLLAVRQTERLKAVVPVTPRDTVYVFIPQATIRTRTGAICSTMAGALPAIPNVGDAIVAFVFGSPVDEQHAIFSVDPARHLLVQAPRATKMMPNRASQAVGETKVESVIARVRTHEGRTHLPWRQVR